MTVPEPRTDREVHLRKPTLASVRESLQLEGSDVADAAVFEQLKIETAEAASRLRQANLGRHGNAAETVVAIGEEDMQKEVAQIIASASSMTRPLYDRHDPSYGENWLIRAMIWLYLNDAST